MKKIGIVILLAVACFFLYAKFIEPHWIRIKVVPIEVGEPSSSSKRLRIIHLSDLHYSNDVSFDYLKKTFKEVARLNPDIICLTGDYINDHLKNTEEYAAVLKILSESAPTFACPGNHDGGIWAMERGGNLDVEEIKNLLTSAGIEFLENESKTIKINDVSVLIAGVGDLWARRLDSDAIKDGLNAANADFKILLSHNPDSKVKLRNIHRDILLCGHTHGGQFYLPLIGTPFAPVIDKRYVNGLCKYEGGRIYVTPAVGSLHGIRFNCRAEISVLELSK